MEGNDGVVKGRGRVTSVKKAEGFFRYVKSCNVVILSSSQHATMGGDHKCPVCQATFTRPQHVARHMRSHTGDRPYKCQYCGDQFARSDLLSRHINKCHSNEKPLVNTGSRRKGSTSASRATTSKQACDQCVQSSLPCDGSNPCGKCVHRKCRCTFVKFHRQTAPVGPGHNPKPTNIPPTSAASSSRDPVYHQAMDDFVLGPAPTSSVPTAPIAADAMYSQSFNFPSSYANSTASSEDYASKYRVHQPEPLRVPGAGTSDGPTFYASESLPSSWWSQQQQRPDQFQGPDSIHDKDLEADLANHLMSTHRHHQQLGMMPVGYPVSYQQLVSRDRRGSVDLASGSDGGSSTVPSSTSSTAGDQYQSQMPFNMNSLTENRRSDFQAAFGSMSLDDPNVLAGLSTDGPPFFSGAMLGEQQFSDTDGTPMPMKLGSDQSHSVSQQQLGRSSSGAVPTPSRESDTRELREFWKAYMRTPLTGPGPDAVHTEGGGGGGGSVAAHTPISYRRPRVASLPNNKTPVVEKDRFHGHQHQLQQQGQNTSNQSSLRTTLRQQELAQSPAHAAVTEDLRSYEAAVMAHKTPITLNLQPRCLNRRAAEGGSSAGSSPVVGWGRFSGAGHLAGGEGAGQPNLPGGDGRLAGAFGRHQQQQSLSVYDASSSSASPASHRSPSADVESGGGASGSDADQNTSQGGSGVRPSFKRVASHTLESDTAKVQRMYSGGGGGGLEEANFNPIASSSSTHVWLEPDSSSSTKTSSWREPSPNWRDHAPVASSSSSSRNVSMDRNRPTTTISIMNANPPPNINLMMMSHPDRVVAASLAERRRMRRMSAPAPRGFFAADGVGGGDGGGGGGY